MGILDVFGFKKGSAKKKAPVPLPKHPLGEVTGYFRKVNAAVIRILRGTLEKGQEIWIKGHTTDLRMTVDSLQVDRQPIDKASKGAVIGVRVSKRVRHGDKVFFASEIEEAVRAAAAAKPGRKIAAKRAAKKKTAKPKPRGSKPKTKKK